MKRLRLSVAGMMAGIGYLAFAFAGLTHPTPLWAEAWLLATLAVLTVALLGAIYARRAFWGGFAIVGWVFLAIHLLPGFAPRLVTHRLIATPYESLSYKPVAVGTPVWVLNNADETYCEGNVERLAVFGLYTVSYKTRLGYDVVTRNPANMRPISPDGYQQLCVSILAPLLGLAGGIVARFLAGKKSQDDSTQK